MDKLINNYEKRINTFVLQMAENPIIVKKEKNKYMTTREALYADMSNKILDKKGFIFSTYKTDKEKLENLSKNLKEALKKQKSLNIIPESLCSKCGRSLEESFCGDGNNDNQKIIKEQNELIEKMKKEMNELRNKYNYSELRLKDLDEIKKEFENLSGALLRPKNDNSTQTEGNDIAINLNSSFITNLTNENTSSNSKNMKNSNNKKSVNNSNNKTTQYKNKFTNNKKTQNQQKNEKSL